MPWRIFVFGMLFSISLFRNLYSSNSISKSYKKPYVFVLYWIIIFCLLTYKKLWYPFPNGLLDWMILLLGSTVPIFGNEVLKKFFDATGLKYKTGTSFLHFCYFISLVYLFAKMGIAYNLWPKIAIFHLLIGLNVVTFVLVYLFVHLLSLQSYTEKLWLTSFLSMYLFVLLTPWYSII